MKNWFESKVTTNILLMGIVILLGAHLIMNMPFISVAKAQSMLSQDTSQSYQMGLKTQDYLKSIDKNIMEIRDSNNSVKLNIGIIMHCIRNTPTGEKAIAVRNIGVQ